MGRPLPLTACLLAACVLSAQDPRLFAPSLARLKANDPKAAEDVKPGSAVERTALSPDLEKAPWARKTQASEWLLRAYIFKQRGLPPAPGAALAGATDPYLAKAWKLLQGAEMDASKELIGRESISSRNSSITAMDRNAVSRNDSGLGIAQRENLWMVLEWLRLEVAWRMKSPANMVVALPPFEKREKLDGREQLHAFMAAAHAGQWPLFIRLGEALSGNGGLDRLKALALQDWGLPDYAGLLKQVQLAVPAAGPGPLPPAELPVKNLGLRLKAFRTEDPALAEKLKASTDWSDSGPVEVPLLRVGAVTHWLKPGGTAMPLVGRMAGDLLALEGSADLALKGGTAWRKERYRLQPAADVAGRWTGTLEVDQQALDGTVPPAQVFHMSFEVRLDLGTVPAK